MSEQNEQVILEGEVITEEVQIELPELTPGQATADNFGDVLGI